MRVLGFFSSAVHSSFPHSLLAEPSPKRCLGVKLGLSEGWLEAFQADAGVDEFDAGRPLVGEEANGTENALRHKYSTVHARLLIQQIFNDWLWDSHGAWHYFSGGDADE